MPTDATPDDIAGVYIEGWKLGLKAIAIYRDGCKRTQPLNTAASKSDTKTPRPAASLEYVGKAAPPVPRRSAASSPTSAARSPTSSRSRGHEGYITVGLYEDGKPGEIFLTMAKEGSTVSGLMDAFATAISLTLQYGVPLEALVDKFTHMRFEPSGFTKNPEIPIAKSIIDYIFRWLGSKFLSAERQARRRHHRARLELERAVAGDEPGRHGTAASEASKLTFETSTDAPACHECGSDHGEVSGVLQVHELRGDVRV